jgi:putative sterol carrier protein
MIVMSKNENYEEYKAFTEQNFVKLQPLIDKKKISKSLSEVDFNNVFDQMALKLKQSSKKWIIVLKLFQQDKEELSYYLDINEGKWEQLKNIPEKFDLEISVQNEVWLKIISGDLAPMGAFTQNKMRIRAKSIATTNEFFKILVDPVDSTKRIFI